MGAKQCWPLDLYLWVPLLYQPLILFICWLAHITTISSNLKFESLEIHDNYYAHITTLRSMHPLNYRHSRFALLLSFPLISIGPFFSSSLFLFNTAFSLTHAYSPSVHQHMAMNLCLNQRINPSVFFHIECSLIIRFHPNSSAFSRTLFLFSSLFSCDC